MSKLIEMLQSLTQFIISLKTTSKHISATQRKQNQNHSSKPLDTPITKHEVAKSIRKLRSNRAPGYDQIPPELLKYTPTELHDLIAEFLNNIFAKREYINVGHGLLSSLQKPGEPKGPTKNRLPVIFLICYEKSFQMFC